MKRSIVHVLLFGLFLSFCAMPLIGSAFAAAFPEATGFGRAAKGGRGGRVIAVTNLNDSGAGSFRAAIEATGPRIIVFRTGGTIKTNRNIIIRNPYVTIAGQTAPGGGICLRGAGIYIITNEVIMRGVRIRVGDDPDGFDPLNRDGLNMDAKLGDVHNVIVDHCSISWAVDENVNLWGAGLRDVTVSNSIISEALYKSIHPEGWHSMGASIGPDMSSITLYGNLWAHNMARNPRLQATNVEFINNVVYNRGQYDMDIGGNATKAQNIAAIGNYFKKGPAFVANVFPINLRDGVVAGTRVFSSDNICDSYTSGSITNQPSFLVNTRPFTSSGVTVKPARTAYEWVLANVGANPQRPDPVDARIIADVKKGTGRIIDKVSDVGGWPTLAQGTPPVDSDGDGMPDSWEFSKGLNPNYASDANSDRDNDGYTNIEEYINSFYTTAAGSATLPAPTLKIISLN